MAGFRVLGQGQERENSRAGLAGEGGGGGYRGVLVRRGVAWPVGSEGVSSGWPVLEKKGEEWRRGV